MNLLISSGFQVYDNYFKDCSEGSINVRVAGQGDICGNTCEDGNCSLRGSVISSFLVNIFGRLCPNCECSRFNASLVYYIIINCMFFVLEVSTAGSLFRGGLKLLSPYLYLSPNAQHFIRHHTGHMGPGLWLWWWLRLIILQMEHPGCPGEHSNCFGDDNEMWQQRMFGQDSPLLL